MLGFDTGRSNKLPTNFVSVQQDPINLPPTVMQQTYVTKNPKWQPLKQYGPDKISDTIRMKKMDKNDLFAPNRQDMGYIEKEVNWYKSEANKKEDMLRELNRTKFSIENDMKEAQHFEDMHDKVQAMEEENRLRNDEAHNIHQGNMDLERENDRLSRELHNMSIVHHQPQHRVVQEVPYHRPNHTQSTVVQMPPIVRYENHQSSPQVHREVK